MNPLIDASVSGTLLAASASPVVVSSFTMTQQMGGDAELMPVSCREVVRYADIVWWRGVA